MKKTITLTSVFCAFLLVFVFQAFYPAPFPKDKEQQLLGKANLYNLQFPQEKIYLHLDRPSYWANDDIWFKAYLLNSPIPDCNLYVELLNSSGEILDKKLCWAQNGLAYGDFHVADTISSGVYQIRAYTSWMRNFDDVWFFRKNLVIWNLRDKVIDQDAKPLKEKDIDFQFFPEGGTFVLNLKNKIAFKATDRNGKGLDVAGKIVDDNGNELIDFKSLFKGMGSFMIQPREGRKYTAQVIVGGKITLIMDLPAPQKEGVSMTIDSGDTTKIHIQISGRSLASEPTPVNDYLMVGQARGVIFYRKEITLTGDISTFEIEKSVLPTGIIQFTLFDKDMIPRCERLVFINHHDFVNIEITPDKPVYLTREKVQLDVDAFTREGIPCLSNLSMSVYNPDTQLKIEDHPNNILTQFLLGSELKGTIEDPAFYFKDDSLMTLLALDNLMLTHGYRQFEWKEILEGKYPEVKFPPLGSLQLKGQVTSTVLGKPVPKAKVTMMTVKSLLGVYETTADSLGRFLFNDLFFKDTVLVSLQAINQKGNRNTEIEIDERSNTSPKAGYLPVNYNYKTDTEVKTTTYLSEISPEIINRKWRLSDTILLGGIDVMTLKKKKDDGHIRPYVDADFVFEVSKYDNISNDIFEMMDVNSASMRRFIGRGVQYFLDGVPVDIEFISDKPVSWFDKVEAVSMAACPHGIGPGLFFYTKRGAPQYVPADVFGMRSYTIIGYSIFRKFYSPEYENNETPAERKDFRSTLYWNPIVRTDSTGVANVSFYNSDQTGEVQIVVEGITSDGKLCRGVGKYKVKN